MHDFLLEKKDSKERLGKNGILKLAKVVRGKDFFLLANIMSDNLSFPYNKYYL